MNLSKELRLNIFNAICKSSNPFFFAENDPEDLIPFLREIWDLKSMPSEDSRFPDAEGDVFQHTVNNDDWDLNELFIERLKLLDSPEKFIKFIEIFLSPRYQKSPDASFEYFIQLNDYLKVENLTLSTVGYEDEYPIFSLTELDGIDHPIELAKNKIPFYTQRYPKRRIDKNINDYKVPNNAKTPCFIIIEDNWNDSFTFFTNFYLIFHNGEDNLGIGFLKIGTKDSNDTFAALPKSPFFLLNDFFSLGQEYSYYENLKKILGPNLKSVLYALKDCSFFPDIADKVDKTDVFKKSLIRDDEVERLYREAKPRILGGNSENLYSFTYTYTPKYAENAIEVKFEFNSNALFSNNIYALIGKNGTGKTQMMTSLPLQISKGNYDSFSPNLPLFSKVIAVSYSIFDQFDIPKKTADFNYVYCGLRDENGDIRSKRGQTLKFHNTWKRIKELSRLKQWKTVLSNFIDEELVNLFIKEDPDKGIDAYFDQKGFKQAESYLSSGQSIVLFVISEIVANIRYDSLLLFDEPETHLHPNAITQLMNTISDLVEEFQSYCIIATHSPLIIQELFSKNVFIMERDGNVPSIRQIGIECFGENLSTLTDEVFGNRNIPRQYKQTIDRLVSAYKDYETVINALQSDNLPCSLNVRLYLKSKLLKS
jgi:ABC-type cobalamin/Fe3+-siderophores transport system ATPase subunit